MINPIYFVLVCCLNAPLTTRHDALLDYVNGYPENVSCGVQLCLLSFLFVLQRFVSYDYLGFWRFPPVCPVNYAVSIVLVLISGGRASERTWTPNLIYLMYSFYWQT
jgi:hypothetical protein